MCGSTVQQAGKFYTAGSVDWNRNGLYEERRLGDAPNWAPGSGEGCDVRALERSQASANNDTENALAWTRHKTTIFPGSYNQTDGIGSHVEAAVVQQCIDLRGILVKIREKLAL